MHYNNLKKNLTIYIILLIFIIIFFQFFLNVYLILKTNYKDRLIHNYGYCEKTSYGFITYIDKKYSLKKNIHIYNDDKSVPYSAAFIHKPKFEFYQDYVILINYNDQKSFFDIKNYTVVEKDKNCFFLKKK